MKTLLIALFSILIGGPHAHAAEPFGIQAHGNFKQVLHTGKAAGVVKLSALASGKGAYGVGALAGMHGEILLWDGRLLVSRGTSLKGNTGAPQAADEAALFVGGKVDAWQEIAIPAELAQSRFESFVMESARKHGIDGEKAFPFAVRGSNLNVVWHVVTGTSPAAEHDRPGTRNLGHSQARIFREAAATGTLLGFHTGAALEGVASHPGERFHVHYASADLTVSGHVDEYRVPKGATLMLPAAAQSPHTHQHSFEDAQKWSQVFDDPKRDAWQKPHEVIQALALPPDAVVADIGSGTGYFAVRFASMVPNGRVYGVDTEPDMMRFLDQRAKREGLKNVIAILGAPDDPRLTEKTDMIVFVDVYHHIESREAYFRRLRDSLKPGGRVAVIDFRMESPDGPPKSARVSPGQVKSELQRAGYRLVREHDFLPNQYFLTFEAAGS